MCCLSSKDTIDSLPQNTSCTAIAWFSTGDTDQKDIDALTTNRTRVYIYKDRIYRYYAEHLNNKNFDNFVDDICKIIDDKRADVFIFGNMYLPYDPYGGDSSGYDDNMQRRIYDLFKSLQTKKPNTLYGLMLRTSPDPGFNLGYLQEVVSCFVYPACNLVPCLYHSEESHMASQDPADKVEQYVKAIVSHVNSNKVYLIIQIGADSSRAIQDPVKTDSYTTFCSVKPSKYRRFCIDDLLNFYKKGKLVWTYKLAGAFLHSYDYDDYHCDCGCGCYAATTAITAGLKGSPEPELTKCTNWTLRYKDRH
ncbi:Glycoside hydrolase superfamily [Cinara cedri]|uniref:Glycoside hydrolase superfamily n=1 Tax=Cinara cedri TaxID=506608 RepID=A0A5E4NCV0_9HEMI|nr:Glycoside hydrolase superfamily [Cinara cedri]